MTLTPEEIADGYRMLDEDEILPDSKIRLHEIELCRNDTSWVPCAFGARDTVLYRTKLSRAELRAARGLPPETTGLTVEEIAREAAFKMLYAIPYLGVIERDRSIIPLISDAINRALAAQYDKLEAERDSVCNHLRETLGQQRDEMVRVVKIAEDERDTLRTELEAAKEELEQHKDALFSERRTFRGIVSERDTLRAENARLVEAGHDALTKETNS